LRFPRVDFAFSPAYNHLDHGFSFLPLFFIQTVFFDRFMDGLLGKGDGVNDEACS
jgi:hypothetical protein